MRSFTNMVDRSSEVVEVPEDSEDARKWPRWGDPGLLLESVHPSNTPAKPTAVQIPSNLVVGTPQAAPASTPKTRPGPRKPKVSLVATPTTTPKTKKLSTLDKSALEWQSYVSEDVDGVQDTLVMNRRGGGYLEKVEFLQRVDDRKNDALEASKGTKRRRE